MMLKRNLESLLADLENLSESEMGQLQGGFSSVTQSGALFVVEEKDSKTCSGVNNCRGGNCTTGCGKN
ncbi:MAG: hypothetical protein IT262_22635 [Saprospiraceae bacterium]|nr:hypothetical protein [Saprospiraceae bacterium]